MQKEGLLLIRMSALRNTPVVSGERQIGFLQDACFDPTRKRVCAFVISCGLRGKKTVLPKHVHSWADGFIVIDGWLKYRNSDQQHSLVFVRDPSGVLAGCVTDYMIDRNTLEVLAVEITPGYLACERNKRIWLYEYHISVDSDEMSIPCSFV